MAKIAKDKKCKSKKITSITIRENRGKDLSPGWADCDSMTASEYLKYYHAAMQYYNLQLSVKDLKPSVIKWMENNSIDTVMLSQYKKTKDWRTSVTMGSIANCLLKGMPEHRDDFNNGKNTKEWLMTAISTAIYDSKHDEVANETDIDTPSSTPVINIQERVREATHRMVEEIEEAIEVWIKTPDDFNPKQLKVNNLLKVKEAKPTHARIIRDYYTKNMQELLLAIEGKDEDIKEGYSHRNKKQLNSLLSFYKEIESACVMLMEEAKVTRKPRAKKAVPKDKLVSKLKYLKVFEPLKLVSINPTDIIGSKELWIYNTKTRKLGRYIADEMVGPIGVKGTTLVGFDENKSIQKTIRKPEEKLKEFKKIFRRHQCN